MQFLFQPLTWGFLLVGVPILVHLINMLRHRRQKWAAMDFLLESYRRNRRWVALKQWLLLASRILAMILLVAMLAQWVSGAQWLSWIGGQTTHHYILLDDSYSMAEVDQGETAYGRGLRALSGLVRSIAGRPGQHQITLIRWSRAALALRSAVSDARIDTAADLLAQSVPRDPGKFLDRLNATQPTSLQLAPEQCIELIAPMIADSGSQQSKVYLISDMRRNEFGEPDTLRNQLQSLTQNAARVQLIDCAHGVGQNLSVVSVKPEQEVWAAGVPLMVRFQVRNRMSQAAKNVVVKVRSVTYAKGSVSPQADRPYSGEVMDLPPLVIEQIGPGETITRQVQVIFGVPGDHVIEVSIADDVLSMDNTRWCTIGIKDAQSVLLVDGDVEQSNAFFFENVIHPDARFSTGMEVEKVDASYLRDVAPERISQFDVIALLDVPRLDPQAVEKLERYCAGGGGVLFIAGPNTNLKFVNEQLYRDGAGLYPVKLDRIETISQSFEDTQPHVTARQHPILAPLLQLESSPFLMLRIRQMLVPNSKETMEPGIELVATGPSNNPMLFDKAFGDGRTLTLMTGLTAQWSNWAQDPTFVVMALRSLGYLGSFRRAATGAPTGGLIEMTVHGQSVLPEAELLIPSRDDGMRVRLLREVEILDSEDLARIRFETNLEGLDRDLVDNLLRPGVFEAWMTNSQGEQLVKNFAHNAPAAEGSLDRVSHSEFERKMRGVPVKIRTAESLSAAGLSSLEAVHSTLLMCLLCVLLLGEQTLAYLASYHTPAIMGVRS